MYWHPFFLPFFSSSLLSLYPPPCCLFYAIQHSSLIAPPSHGSLYPCSDKDLLSQTRTLAMSFVKCASTDTEHQYKLVKDISFWQTHTCRLTVTPNWRYKLTGFFFSFFFFAQKIQEFDFGGLTANRKWTGWHDASSLLSVYDSQDAAACWCWIQSFLDSPFQVYVFRILNYL